jgi:hypothetical protein
VFPLAFRDSSADMTSSARNLRFQRGMTTECTSQRIAFRPCGTQRGTTADCHGTTADEGVKSSSAMASLPASRRRQNAVTDIPPPMNVTTADERSNARLFVFLRMSLHSQQARAW